MPSTQPANTFVCQWAPFSNLGNGIVCGKYFQRPDPRVTGRIVHGERRDEARLQRYLATRKTLRQQYSRAAFLPAFEPTARQEFRAFTRDVYARIEIVDGIGRSPVNPTAVVIVLVSAANAMLQVQGAEAARCLGLSTQVPLRPIFWTFGPARRIRQAASANEACRFALACACGTSRWIGSSRTLVFRKEGSNPDNRSHHRKQAFRIRVCRAHCGNRHHARWMRSAFVTYRLKGKRGISDREMASSSRSSS